MTKAMMEVTVAVSSDNLEVQELKVIIDRFVTKSNGLSRWVRMDFGQEIPKDLTQEIKSLYNFQCEVEQKLRMYE
jgi:hypothetical protein